MTTAPVPLDKTAPLPPTPAERARGRLGHPPLLTARAILWSRLYILLIPFVNWAFSWSPNFDLGDGIIINPMTIVTGLVLVVRDFVQRAVGHWVFADMATALLITLVVAGPELALASGAAFAISELVDWALYTFSRLPLWQRVILSSAVAAPVDTTLFLYGADLAFGDKPDAVPFLTWPNVIVSITGKMIGAVVIALVVRETDRRAAARGQAAPDLF